MSITAAAVKKAAAGFLSKKKGRERKGFGPAFFINDALLSGILRGAMGAQLDKAGGGNGTRGFN